MNIAVISTGDELLKGTILNTNFAFLSRELARIGATVGHASSAGDCKRDIYTAMAHALDCAEIVIISGGLGPTRDDITLDAVARFFGLALEPHPDLTKKVTDFWHLRHKERVPQAVLRQSRLPQGAKILPNFNGSVSGIQIDTIYDNKLRHIFLLPGPPREFEPMIRATLLPIIADYIKDGEHEYTMGFLATGVPEFQLQQSLEPALNSFPVKLAYCATFAGTRVFVSGKDENIVKDAVETARKLSGTCPLPVGELDLTRALLAELEKRDCKLVTAESCTGGMISAALTAIPGSSKSFHGGVVVYSNALKHQLLGIDPEIFSNFGAVSSQCAEAMVDGAIERFKVECAIAVTGIAGPGSDDTAKPVGLVYIAVKAGDKRRVKEFHFSGDRNAVRERSCNCALLMLYTLLHEQP
ncbi:MAG: nicotinamide-nucleotide amidohydrolase family protein [Victivallales bacterium]|jgi:nicotinamide-nucleotide amidase|nr:nicotinamide-nucleotide amidohydrolase family protein [Victivallales bacterium]